MTLCVHLPLQIEEAYIGADDFCRVLKQEVSTVLRSEVPLLQGLRFELVVHSPYRALTGFLQVQECGTRQHSCSLLLLVFIWVICTFDSRCGVVPWGVDLCER